MRIFILGFTQHIVLAIHAIQKEEQDETLQAIEKKALEIQDLIKI